MKFDAFCNFLVRRPLTNSSWYLSSSIGPLFVPGNTNLILWLDRFSHSIKIASVKMKLLEFWRSFFSKPNSFVSFNSSQHFSLFSHRLGKHVPIKSDCFPTNRKLKRTKAKTSSKECEDAMISSRLNPSDFFYPFFIAVVWGCIFYSTNCSIRWFHHTKQKKEMEEDETAVRKSRRCRIHVSRSTGKFLLRNRCSSVNTRSPSA